VTFIPEARIEARAAEQWRTHSLAQGFDVERLLDVLGLGLVWEPVADEGDAMVLGQLIPEQRLVVLNERHFDRLEANGGRLRRYTVGHEIGHWILHAEALRSGTLSMLDGGRIWCRDGSPDPVERQAEIFSAALLMPRHLVRAALPPAPWHGWGPVYRLADAFVVSVTAMKIRLEKLGWMHIDEGTPVSGPQSAPGQAALFPPT
jgi:uncharacterized protein DUF955